jgi:hypothetical protein
LFSKLSKIRPIYFLDGYDTELLNILKQLKNTTIINTPLSLNGVKIIPKKFNVITNIETTDDIIFINSQISNDNLYYVDKPFYCGFHDKMNIDKNIIHVGTPYQFDKKSSSGVYVLDVDSKKHKYFDNKINSLFETYHLTDLKQLEDFDKEYIKENNISIEIDKSLILDKTLKIEVLLNDFEFKSVTYINDNVSDELINNSSLNMEQLLQEKINESENPDIKEEFDKILKLYKEKY